MPEGIDPASEDRLERQVIGRLEIPQSVEALDISGDAKFAASLANRAGFILVDKVDQIQDRTAKGRTNFKIAIDDEIDTLTRTYIEQQYPNDSINSEELADKTTGSDRVWLVDPLDGTIPFTLRSSDHSAVSIALAESKVPQLGVINVALKGELFVAERGKGSFLNGEPIHTGQTEDLNLAVVGIDYGKNDRTRGLVMMQKLLGPDGITYPMTYGGSAATLALVASGRLDGYASHDIEPWDVAAAVVICEESGAMVTNFQGEPWTTDDLTILVANPALHEKLLALVV